MMFMKSDQYGFMRIHFIAGIIIILFIAGCKSKIEDRPSEWAVSLSRPGLSNLYKVSDQLYRGAKPESDGFIELKKMGVRTVVNLEMFHSDEEPLQLSKTNLNYEPIPMKTWEPETEQVVQFIRIMADTAKTPVFVHCYHGSDRTGTMCAVYRIIIQNWSKEQALREMKDGGFGFHAIWQNLPVFINNLDVERIRKEAGL